jgi:hypothetical protein
MPSGKDSHPMANTENILLAAEASTLVEVLHGHALERPAQLVYTFLSFD